MHFPAVSNSQQAWWKVGLIAKSSLLNDDPTRFVKYSQHLTTVQLASVQLCLYWFGEHETVGGVNAAKSYNIITYIFIVIRPYLCTSE